MRAAWASWAAGALVDLVWPESCAGCGAGAGSVPWEAVGVRVPGLRAWDRPHLCRACGERLREAPRLHVVRLDDGAALPIAAGRGEDADLVALVGALKYHGLRGLAWTLTAIAAPASALLADDPGGAAALVPVPLHAGRRRERGFNQAELLARLLASASGRAVLTGVARRRRATSQQARIASDPARRRANVAGAFAASPVPAGAPPLWLVDDLATSGRTLAELAAALRGAGWTVAGALVAGAAADCGAAASVAR